MANTGDKAVQGLDDSELTGTWTVEEATRLHIQDGFSSIIHHAIEQKYPFLGNLYCPLPFFRSALIALVWVDSCRRWNHHAYDPLHASPFSLAFQRVVFCARQPRQPLDIQLCRRCLLNDSLVRLNLLLYNTSRTTVAFHYINTAASV